MNSAKRILIFSGGSLGPWALGEVRAADILVGVDRGALFLLRNKLTPDAAFGDFDSVTADELREIRRGCCDVSACDPVAKDYSDTELAFRWALDREPREIILLGALGTRFDHSLANVHLLVTGLERNIPCRIIDEKNEIILINKKLFITRGAFPNISLLPLSPVVTGITLKGFMYPLTMADLTMGESLALSNILTEETGTISIETGLLLVIRSRD